MKNPLHGTLVGLLIFSFILANFPDAALAASPTPIFNDPAFEKTWNRVDKPVQDLPGTPRGYTWGPVAPGAEGISKEQYDFGSRKVQYFDKARMEITNPQGNPDDLFYVTTGLLVKELVTGNRQEGDNIFAHFIPSQVQVAGDSNETGANAIAPTYASFSNVGTFSGTENGKPNLNGSVINTRIDRAGNVTTFQPPEQRPVKGYDEVTKHNIPDVFVDYGNITGPTWNGSHYIQGAVFFNLPLYIFGRPLTEAYWTRAVVAGKEQDVLVQLFERRVLTYTPANPPAYRVEMGNVGQHYFRWRYEQHSGLPTPALIAKNVQTVFTGYNNDKNDKIFWLALAGQNSYVLKEYDPATRQETTIKQWPDGFLDHNTINGLVSDGNYVVWSESQLPTTPPEDGKPLPEKFKGYDLIAKNELDILEARRGDPSYTFAVAGGVLYYSDSAPNHTGFFTRRIPDAGLPEIKINNIGARYPVAHAGFVLYTNLSYPSGPHLYLLRPGDTSPRIIATAPDNFGFSGYDISGDAVVWSFSSPDVSNRVFLYNSASGQLQTVSPYMGYLPKISGNFITWQILKVYHPPTGPVSVQLYRRDTGKVLDISEVSGDTTISILDSGLLVFTRNSSRDVYVLNLNDIR